MFKRPARAVSRVFLHCSDSDYPEHSNLRTIRQWHLARGFADVGYHFFIGFDGTIEPGRSLERLPAAQRGHNTDSLAICLAGGQNQSANAFTAAQFKSLRALCGAINDAYNGQITFHGHSEVSDKACPVFNYAMVLGLSPTGHLRKPRPDLGRSRTFAGGRIASGGAVVSAIATSLPDLALEQLLTPIKLDPASDPTREVLDAPVEWSRSPVQAVENAGLAENLFDLAQFVQTILPWAALVMVVAGIGIVLLARMDDHERGLR